MITDRTRASAGHMYAKALAAGEAAFKTLILLQGRDKRLTLIPSKLSPRREGSLQRVSQQWGGWG